MENERKYVHLKIPKFALIVAAIGIGTFFAGYYFATYSNVGYESGFMAGYTKGVNDLYVFNSQPDKWLTFDQKPGVALINGTTTYFVWNEGNNTKEITLKSSDNLGLRKEQGILYLMADHIQIPPLIAKAMNIQQKQYYVFQNTQNQRYLLQLAG